MKTTRLLWIFMYNCPCYWSIRLYMLWVVKWHRSLYPADICLFCSYRQKDVCFALVCSHSPQHQHVTSIVLAVSICALFDSILPCDDNYTSTLMNVYVYTSVLLKDGEISLVIMWISFSFWHWCFLLRCGLPFNESWSHWYSLDVICTLWTDFRLVLNHNTGF